MFTKATASILLVLIGISSIIVHAKSDKIEHTISECVAKSGECDENRERSVCGTDDKTYPSRCHLLRIQCTGHEVSVKHRGPCKECLQNRQYALKNKEKYQSLNKFIPKCRSDGTYAAVQCIENGCWCSDSSGKPIADTMIRNGKPNCRKYGRGNIRRSPPRHLNPNNAPKECTSADHTSFLKNVLLRLHNEYVRERELKPLARREQINDENILNWKFANLDINSNGILDKNEFRKFKRLIKKAVKPRQCARAFGKMCDTNDDEKLTINGLRSCLSSDSVDRYQAMLIKNGRDRKIQIQSRENPILTHHYQTPPNNSYHKTFPLNAGNGHHDDDNNPNYSEYDESEEYDTEESDDDDNLNHIHKTNITAFSSVMRPKSDDTLVPNHRESDGESSDCLADRSTAFEEQKNGNTVLYIPECTTDGRYQRVQCYHTTGYCWCVDEDNGKVIPGSSLKDKRPQCAAIPRPLKGCPEPKKAEFLRELKEFLKSQITATGSFGPNSTKWNTEDEKIATLSFVLLDKNKNKIWERKEWKSFRDLVNESKVLKKCGKKMPRYCDVNSDKKITIAEWMNCLQTQRPDGTMDAKSYPPIAESSQAKQLKLTGPNPLESYLKE